MQKKKERLKKEREKKQKKHSRNAKGRKITDTEGRKERKKQG